MDVGNIKEISIMSNFLGKFFSTSNDINENTVMGVIFAIALLCSVFIGRLGIDLATQGVLAASMASFFGLSLGKK